MASTKLDFPVFDSDNHLYETTDSFLKYMPKQYEGKIKYVQVNGRTKIAINNMISDYIPNPTFEVVARPGAHMEFFKGDNPEGKTLREITGEPMKAIPAFREPGARVQLLDELAIDATLLFPTLASVLEVNMMDDPDLALASIHSFNQWMHDVWTFNYQNRIFPTPVINLSTCEGGIAELEWVLERGAKVVLIRPAPVGGFRGSRSPFLPEFDAFWARVAESGILVTLHVSDSGYQRYINDWEGTSSEHLPFKPGAFRQLSTGHRPIMDSIFSAVAHGMLSRHKGVKIATVENGSDWVPRVIEDFKGVYGKMPQEFDEDPVEAFQRQVYVNPFWEDPLHELNEILDIDHILFGSDWPHPEGLDDPVSWSDYCLKAGYSKDDVAKMMGGNLMKVMGVKVGA
jgi:predicted TIM-barrel fold metal-dependent hydrolase